MTKVSHILNSWKEIASYFGRSVRSVQRWAEAQHLPIHRITPGSKKSPVFAYREELDRWMQNHVQEDEVARTDKRLANIKESRDKLLAIQQRLRRTASQQRKVFEDRIEQTRQNRFTFMSTDLDAALTLAKFAEGASDARKRTRNVANARRALAMVLALYRTSKLAQGERQVLEEKIAKVRTALERLASRTAGISLKGESQQLRLRAMRSQLKAAFNLCSSAEAALTLGQVQFGRDAVEKVKHTAQVVRRHVEEPKRIPADSVAGIRDQLTGLDKEICDLEVRLQRLQSERNILS